MRKAGDAGGKEPRAPDGTDPNASKATKSKGPSMVIAPGSTAPPAKRLKKVNNDNQLRYFNGDVVQEADKVSVHFANGDKASEGTVVGRSASNQMLVQLVINSDAEEFYGEDGELYHPGKIMVIHGSFLLPMVENEIEAGPAPTPLQMVETGAATGPDADAARERMTAAGYVIGKEVELRKVHCNQQEGCQELPWIENGFVQCFAEVDGRRARVLSYAPSQQLQPHRHDIDELFEIRGGGG